MSQNTALNQEQIPDCEICKAEPIAESSQYLAFLISEMILMFVNIKLAVIAVMIGYSLCKTIWVCPICKREVEFKGGNIGNNMVVRIGNCVMLFSKFKFRTLAVIVISVMGYLYLQEPKYKFVVPKERTWESLVANCGYTVYVENSVKTNHLYHEYCESGNDWVIEAIFLKESQYKGATSHIFMKMNPTQYADPETEDIMVFTEKYRPLNLQRGDEVRLYGEWEGRAYQTFIFIPFKLEKTGRNIAPETIKVFSSSKNLIREQDSYEQPNQPSDQ